MLSAEELHGRGLARSNAGRYASARQLFRRALARADVPDTIARVKLSLGYVEAELGSTAQGLALCAEALTEPGLSRQVRGLVESQIALLQMRSGAGQAALGSFAAAIALLDDSPESRARAYLNRGLVYLHRGDAERAAQDSRRAAELYRAAGDEVEAAKADHNLGYSRLLLGDLVTALRMMEAAAPLLEGLSATYQAVVSQDRAEVLVAAGMPADALAAFEKAARAYGFRGLRQRQAEVELLLAQTLAWDDPLRASTVARRAERRFRLRGSEAWALRAEGVKLTAEIEAGSPSRRAGSARRAAELALVLRQHGLRHDALAMTLSAARAELAAGDLAAAGRQLARARPGPATPLPVRLLASEVRAEVAAAKGRRKTALGHVRRGLEELHGWQSGFGSLDLQSSLVGHGRRLAFDGIRLALADGHPDVVFEWSERARTLASRVMPVRPPGDPDAVRALAELRQAPDEATASALRARIRQQAWYGEGSRRVTEPTTLDEVEAALSASGGVLASYVTVDDTLTCLVVGEGRRDVVPLGGLGGVRALLSGMQADLDMAAIDLPPAIRGVVDDALRDRVTGLARLLVAPLGDRLDADRLVVVPAGALAGTPWPMLPGLQNRALTVPRSTSLWLTQRERPFVLDRVGLVAGPDVPRAEEEVSLAAARWAAAEVLRGPRARSAEVSDLAGRVDVLHVAAHGRHSADNPLFSGLELADGPWFGYDIDQLSSIPLTVILSACELGRSSLRWGRETIGMTVAWLHAGARCVVAAPASVADDVACEVLNATHSRLALGHPPAEALADAVREVKASDLSSFQCFGAGW
jgi:tetratricopeptide (TPR) repeat protein